MKRFDFRKFKLSLDDLINTGRSKEECEKAFEVYSNSSFVFHNNGGCIWLSENQNEVPSINLGTMKDVVDFLNELA